MAEAAAGAAARAVAAGAGRGRSARAHLVALVLAVLVPGLVFAAVLAQRYAASERARLEEGADQAARGIAAAIDRDLDGLVATLRTLATSRSLRDGDLAGFHQRASEVQGFVGEHVVLRDPAGQQLANTRLPFGSPLPRTPFDIDRQAVETRRPVVSDLFTGAVAQRPLYAVVVPVPPGGGGGETKYLLNMSIGPERLLGLFGQAGLPPEGVAVAVDGRGVVLARSAGHDRSVGQPMPGEWLRAARRAAEGLWSGANLEGVPVLSAHARSGLTGWTVAVEVPRDVFAAPLTRALLGLGALGASLLALGLLLALALAGRLSRSIAALAGAGAALGRDEPVGPVATSVAEVNAVGSVLAAASAGRRESEERLRLAHEGAGLGSWEFDVATGEMRWSARQRELFGLDPSAGGALPVDVWRSAVHPGDRERAGGLLAATLATGEPYDAEYRVVLPDGRTRWIATRGRFAADGRARIAGVSLDVTPRREAAEALARANAELEDRVAERTRELSLSEARVRAYFEHAAEALFDVAVTPGGEFRLEGLNPRAEEISGLAAADLGDRALEDLLGERVAGRMAEHFRRCVEGGAPYRYTEETRLPGGTYVLDTILVPLREAATGRVARLLGSARDVTALKAAEEQLRQSHKMEALGQLTGGLAHDFNNLLAVVLGNLKLARKRLAPSPGREGGAAGGSAGDAVGGAAALRLIDGAVHGAERGAVLTKRLLAFARRQTLEAGPVDVPALVNGMADLLARSLGPLVRLRADFPEGLPPARVDANQLELALLNLAVNARDAMPLGGPLRVSAREAAVVAGGGAGGGAGGAVGGDELAPGRYVCLEVADTGGGMDRATLARAAEPFFTTKGVGKGTGLGLSMVHGLAAQSGGALRLRSEPGQGTTAELWLPAAEGVAAAAAGPPPVAGAGAVAPRRRRCTVLAVDDDALVLMGTAAMLEELGHAVVQAYSGPEALQALRRSDPAFDLVLTDQAMPGMTGVELAAEVAAGWPGLPVLLATGYAELPPGAGAELPRLGKPFGEEALAEAIAALVGPATDDDSPAAAGEASSANVVRFQGR